MCGRFTLTLNPDDIENFISNRFNTHIRGHGIPYPYYNIAPSMDVLSVLYDGKDYRAGYLTWGYRGFDKRDFSVINIRSETMFEKPMFKNSVHSKRCIVLADGYYEWHEKTPYYIHREDKSVFAIASLWNITKDKEGKTHNTVGLITQASKDIFESVHDRMPIILKDDEIETWLQNGILEDASKQASEFEVYPVSKAVNKVINNEESLIMKTL